MSESELRELDRLEDRIRLHLEGADGFAIVVEGPDDVLVLDEHLPEADLFPSGGRHNALVAIEALSGWGVSNVAAVVDRDYAPVEGDRIKPYDGRDLEGMLVRLGVLATVLQHHGSSEKIEASGGIQEVVGRVLREAEFVSALRAVNQEEALGLPFDDVDLAKKVDHRSLQLNRQSYCSALIAGSGMSLNPATLIATAEARLPDAHGPSGKDSATIAGVALRAVAGSRQAAAVTGPVMLSSLRSSAAHLLSRSTWLADLRSVFAVPPV